ncbi:MAG TPA: transposase [Steroidobacteraceae bacterium]|nr:transposase [Steroidobacteraceae bacterium]
MDTSTEQSAGTGSGGRQVRRRKQWSVQEKLQIVRETLQSEGSVPVIARRHGVNANQIFTWRREYRRGKLLERGVETARDRKAAPALLPVQIHVPMKAVPQEARAAPASPSPEPERVEIEFASGTRLRIWGGLGKERLQAILRELAGPC